MLKVLIPVKLNDVLLIAEMVPPLPNSDRAKLALLVKLLLPLKCNELASPKIAPARPSTEISELE